MAERDRASRRIRGVDGYGNDRWMFLAYHSDLDMVIVHAARPVRLDVHGVHRLSSSLGTMHWRMLTGGWPPDEPHA